MKSLQNVVAAAILKIVHTYFPIRVCLIFLWYVIVIVCHGALGPIIIFHWFFYYLRVSAGNRTRCQAYF